MGFSEVLLTFSPHTLTPALFCQQCQISVAWPESCIL